MDNDQKNRRKICIDLDYLLFIVVAVAAAPPADYLRYSRFMKTHRPSAAAAAATVWAWRRLSRTSPSMGNLMDVASPSEAASRIPQMAE